MNPYLAIAALVAAGLHGIEQELELEAAFDRQRLRRPGSRARPATLRDALDLWQDSSWPARRSATTWWRTTPTWPRVELAAFDAAVTDWELVRGFERL